MKLVLYLHLLRLCSRHRRQYPIILVSCCSIYLPRSPESLYPIYALAYLIERFIHLIYLLHEILGERPDGASRKSSVRYTITYFLLSISLTPAVAIKVKQPRYS